MCGVVGGAGVIDRARIARISHRGPDATGSWQGERYWLGHTRLSILDLDPRSGQPFKRGRIALSYNGELWNWQALRRELEDHGQRFSTTGDTEVIAAALDLWGEAALSRFEGMFAIAWSEDGGETLKLARDRFGEVPLHVDLKTRAFASEAKAMPEGADVAWVEPGHIVEFNDEAAWQRAWYHLPKTEWNVLIDEAATLVRAGLEHGTLERSVSDVGYCLLLSGGIDSSAIAYHASQIAPGLDAYVAVDDGSPSDLKGARAVASACGLRLFEVKIPKPTAADLAGVVRAIEMPHKAQVEIGWACSVLAKRIRADGHRVVLSGEGSDEMWASYGMAYHGIAKQGWFNFRRRLFHDQHRKNFARCNKVFMREGVECRLPFLSTELVELGLGLPEVSVREKGKPKAVLQRAYRGILPDFVIDRQKMTFQDGVGLQDACAAAVPDPQRFYRSEHAKAYGRMDT